MPLVSIVDMDLNGKVALVTGGSRGIGGAIALALARSGADVAVNYRSDSTGANEVVRAMLALGGRALAVRADVSSPLEVERLVTTVTRELGEIAILVNNAGIATTRSLDDLDLATFDQTIDVNLRSAFLVTTAVLPAMRRNHWGRLIFMASTAANVGGVIGPHYAASKAGIVGLMHGYASGLVKEGITANALSPALIETDMIRRNPHVQPDRIPLGRFGTVDEVADVAVLLARNAFITGQTININGGLYPTS